MAQAQPIRPGARAVVLNDAQAVLLHMRGDFPVWALPGGGIEPGEEPQQAAIREVWEETGYEIAVDWLVGEYTRPQSTIGYEYIFRGRVIGGQPIARGAETRAVRWFPVTALPLQMPGTHRQYIRDGLLYAGAPRQVALHMSPFEATTIRIVRRLRRVLRRR